MPLSPQTTRWVHAVHKWTGLIVGINVLLFSVTAVYLLADEMVHHYLEHGEEQERVALDPDRRQTLQPAIEQIEAHFKPAAGYVGRVIPAHFEGDLDRFLVVAGDHNFLIYQRDPYTGAISLERGNLPEGVGPLGGAAGAAESSGSTADAIAAWMLELHSELLLETLGTLIVGGLGILFLISTVTGWMIYGPFMKSMIFGFIRRRGPWRLPVADLHKLVGIAALAFNLVMAITGLGLTFGIFGIQYKVMADLNKNEATMGTIVKADPLPPFEEIWATAQALFPDQYVSRIDFPVELAIQGTKVYASYSEPDPRDPGLVPSIGIITAETTPRAHPYHLVWWMKAILWGGRMHTGALGGQLVLFAYLLLSLSSGFLSVSGYFMYIAKWRKARRAKFRRAAEATDPDAEEGLPEQVAARTLSQG